MIKILHLQPIMPNSLFKIKIIINKKKLKTFMIPKLLNKKIKYIFLINKYNFIKITLNNQRLN